MKRENWSNRFIFILATVSAAVGLGNLWKFPYITWENGGGLFILIYLICIILIGLPMMIAELYLGKKTSKNPYGAFKSLNKKSPFRYVGLLGIFIGVLILSYYAIVTGWALKYQINSFNSNFLKNTTSLHENLDLPSNKTKQDIINHMKTNDIKTIKAVKNQNILNAINKKLPNEVKNQLLQDANLANLNFENKALLIPNLEKDKKLKYWQNYFLEQESQKDSFVHSLNKYFFTIKFQKEFEEFITDKEKMLLWQSIIMLLILIIILGGVRSGIELLAKITMPLLFLFMFIIIIFANVADENKEGLKFLLWGYPHKITSHSFLEALSHAFFTLSIGMGSIITYGSYLDKKTSIVKSSYWIVFFDTLIALLACLMIFPIIFTYNFMPSSSSNGILFTVIPLKLSHLQGGQYLSILFYTLIFIAALTSAMSLLEPIVAFFMDEFKLTRKRASILSAFLIFLIGIPSALSINFLTQADNMANLLLPIGGFFIAIFIGYFVSKKDLLEEFLNFNHSKKMFYFFYNSIRYITPILILIMMMILFGDICLK